MFESILWNFVFSTYLVLVHHYTRWWRLHVKRICINFVISSTTSSFTSRKEEAVSRPKMEFVPKTLADLHIEGVHDMNNGRRYGSTQSLSRPRPTSMPPSSSVGDLSDPLRAWESPARPKVRQPVAPAPGFKPHPAPRNQLNGRDPWKGDSGFICYLFYVPFLVVDWLLFCINTENVVLHVKEDSRCKIYTWAVKFSERKLYLKCQVPAVEAIEMDILTLVENPWI